MTDAISRRAAIQALQKAKELASEPPTRFDIYIHKTFDLCIRLIAAFDAIDAVPVVRCKDCKAFLPYTEAHRKASGFDGDCAIFAGYTDCGNECVHEMDFCSRGKHEGTREV